MPRAVVWCGRAVPMTSTQLTQLRANFLFIEYQTHLHLVMSHAGAAAVYT